MPAASSPRRLAAVKPLPPVADKRDAILRAAIKVFAQNGFFQSQVADIARVAGVAAGTVYLYFKSKDDLLVSVFERTMKEAIAEGRAALDGVNAPADRLRTLARLHLERLGRDRDLAVVFQVELRQTTKFMERFSSTHLREYLDQIRQAIADGQAAGVFRKDVNPTMAAKVLFGALDEMATNWILSRRKYALAGEADAVVDLLVGGLGGMSHINVNAVTVLGAGTMGAQIALHFANVGIPSLLLDLTADAAKQGLEKARRLKPDPQFTPDVHTLVTTGAFDTHLDQIATTDWVMEAIVERLDVKQQLLARVDAARRPGTIVSSNTSGIPIGALAEGRSDDFRRHWLGTHFFNPPRYLRLLEVIPTPDTMPEVIATVTRVGDRLLGKGVVVAKDTPNFIGNHIALYGVACMLQALAAGPYTIEEIDAITGPAIGRPGSATFRTMDIAGVDVLAHVMRNLNERLADPGDRAAFAVPPFLDQMVARGQLGEKTGKGFYERRKNASGETEIWTLDLETLEYRPKQAPKIGSIEAGKSMDDLAERVRMLFHSTDKAGAFLRETLAPTLIYTARVTPEIAHSIDDVDRVMRWGFGWDLGPFELFDTLGIREVAAAARAVGGHAVEGGIPPLVQSALDAKANRFREGLVAPAAADLQILRSAREQERIVKRNAGASLVDLGDGVLAVEFHSKMNAIGGDTIAMLQAGVKEAAKSHRALVVGNDAPTFSAGANLMLVLLEAQEGNFDELDLMIRQFQQAMMLLRYSDVPVVVAPAGLALGGGVEVILHGDRVQAAAETYMGLVEVGVGLIPAGGGTKEMLVRAMAEVPGPQSDPLPWVQKAFETIALAKVSASGPDAVRLGYLAPTDAFTMNRERLMADAKAKALERVREGYHKPAPRMAVRVGGESVTAALKLGVHLAWRAGRASDHDALIGRKLAHIFGGGALPHATTVSEQYLLDLEREAFLSLLGEPKTLERIQHTLKTGKPLRN